MSLPLKIKLETALVAYVKARLKTPSLKGIVPGHTNAEPTLPYLVVYCGEAPAHPDMPPEAGIKLATVVFHLKTNATDEERAKADYRIDALQTMLLQPVDDSAPYSDDNKAGGTLLAFLNKPDTGPDARDPRVRQFHAYDLWINGDSSSNAGTVWHDQLVMQVACQPFDSH